VQTVNKAYFPLLIMLTSSNVSITKSKFEAVPRRAVSSMMSRCSANRKSFGIALQIMHVLDLLLGSDTDTHPLRYPDSVSFVMMLCYISLLLTQLRSVRCQLGGHAEINQWHV
jgi:hypothetical protein